MSRVQLALNVVDIDAAVDFYGGSSALSQPSAVPAMPISPSPTRRSSWS
jgi:hypothetical protein